VKITDELLLQYFDQTLDDLSLDALLNQAKTDEALADTLSALKTARLPYKDASRLNEITMPDSLRSALLEQIKTTEENTKTFSDHIRKADVDIQNSTLTHDTLASLASHSAANSATQQQTINKTISRAPKASPRPGNRFAIAGLVATFCVGLFAGHLLSDRKQPNSNVTDTLTSATANNWVETIVSYQSLYVDNTVKHIKASQEQAQTLLNNIQARSNLVANIPDFSEHGYRFVRAQELGYEGEPLVQLVYYKEGEAPLAFCYMPDANVGKTGIAISEFGNLSAASWAGNKHRYVIVGSASDETLKSLHALSNTI